MKRAFWLAVMLIGGFVVIGMAWRGRSGGNDSATLVVGVSGNTQGSLEPCGCQAGQSGGLARRQTLLQQQKVGLLVDTGNVFGGTGTYERLKGAYLLRGMKHMGYAAVNLGEAEISLPVSELSPLSQQSSVSFVSCNATANGTPSLPIVPFRIETRSGLRVGITGIVDMADSSLGKGWIRKPPLEALAATLPALQAQCDVLIVLASAPDDTLAAIAQRFPEIDALFGSTPDAATGVSQINRTALFTTGIKGKSWGRLTFAKHKETARLSLTATQIIKVPDTLTPDPKIAALINEFHTELRTRRIEFATAEGMERIETQDQNPNGKFIGQAKCISCHANAHRATQVSAHAHAYQTLASKGADANPECLRCHTVGFGAKDGFFTLETTPQLANVQCESCHGRGALHLKAVQESKTGLAATKTLALLTPNACLHCHDTENSPKFEYAAYWRQIRHTK